MQTERAYLVEAREGALTKMGGTRIIVAHIRGHLAVGEEGVISSGVLAVATTFQKAQAKMWTAIRTTERRRRTLKKLEPRLMLA
jgi:hypothetical protein